MAESGNIPLELASHSCGEASIHTRLEDGRMICIRTVTPKDEDRLRAGIARMSPRSRYLRFFSGGASPPDWVIERLLDADGVLHLAWGALDLSDPDHPAMGVVHAMRPDKGDAVAEFSVGVVDAYHGLGIGRLLTATLLLDAAGGQLEAFRAHVLSENDAARSFIKRLGGQHVAQDGPQAEYRVEVAPALERLREERHPPGLADIFTYFDIPAV
ncbi:GNAT family N-acetyltransferase [Qipengyuania sp. SS22]|uniref:GNAT family N-acetyltransferase n=1 Tax=Qipengyuania sp. SS22 TaxID=2979461 RepID=UPI0021E62451|nr:GNAT family N-acetyltransferase [Qipengyuania sp. SS22]UYH56193.1 GNAT family N-acetyltransferase [Qipengyuania sp. SS22]